MTIIRSYQQAVDSVSYDRPIRRKAWGDRQFLIAKRAGGDSIRRVVIEPLPAGQVNVISSQWRATDEDVRADDWQVCVLAKWLDLPDVPRGSVRMWMTWPTDLLMAVVEALALVYGIVVIGG